MVNACNLSNPYLFADDGALLFENICRKTYLSIKIEMLTIIKWLSANKLSLRGPGGGGGGGLHQDFLEIDFLVVSDREE